MRNVEVAAEDDRLRFVKGEKIFPKVVLPLHTVVKPTQSVLCVRRIAGDEIKLFKFKCYQSSLRVVHRNIHAVEYGYRLFFCENCRARITLFFGIVPILIISVKRKVNLSLLKLRFLKTENVCVKLLERVKKAFLYARTDSVYIP